ncbi:MAG: nickel pincer cofactor biosynthesis protein LarB [Bradymonadaceae bacterium]
MSDDSIRELLRQYRDGELDEDEIVQRVVRRPFEENILGRFEPHREARTGIPEVVLAEGKNRDELVDLFVEHAERGKQLIATRVDGETGRRLESEIPDLARFEEARIAALKPAEPDDRRHEVLVISAGASDGPTAREAAVASRLLGNPTEELHDVGVAGLNRFAADIDSFDAAGIVVVVAGMDGALPSVIGGLARQPVIAVPTSVGYGAHLDGMAPLLTMLNSCAPGTAVVNIDNGFGAAALATKMNRLALSDPRE